MFHSGQHSEFYFGSITIFRYCPYYLDCDVRLRDSVPAFYNFTESALT